MSNSKSDRPLPWLKGSMVALVTPFKDGEVDVKGLQHLVELHVREGTSALVPCGTTGESATLSHEEHEQVVEMTIQAARGRVRVIAGTGSNNTEEALRFTRHAQKAGADAALLISPYYNKPTQEGLYRHFRTIAESADLPLVLYNIASRTGVNVEPETFSRLAKIPNIVGVKEASGSLEQMSRIRALCGERFSLLSGDDALTLPVLAIGGTGVISVTANIVPGKVARMVRAFEQGNLRLARRIHYELLPLTRAMFIETNPIPVKTAMGLMKLIDEAGLRLPLCPMSDGNLSRLREVLRSYRLIR
ncbi:MAG: 4-hydroxy-tetrahydrodipicolinate synthase [Candidatus Omnitrophica bacterium]|nr:4-hydroxy-tetrahydrodipicolinate synthase [Candidatus Omnitrophota bacterium]